MVCPQHGTAIPKGFTVPQCTKCNLHLHGKMIITGRVCSLGLVLHKVCRVLATRVNGTIGAGGATNTSYEPYKVGTLSRQTLLSRIILRTAETFRTIEMVWRHPLPQLNKAILRLLRYVPYIVAAFGVFTMFYALAAERRLLRCLGKS